MIDIKIDHTGNSKLLINGRAAFVYCDHFLMKLSLERINCNWDKYASLHWEIISHNNIADCELVGCTTKKILKYLFPQSDTTRGYIYYDGKDPVGCLWLAFKGANEYEYRVRNVDAFGFDFEVREEYRSRGIIGYMIYTTLLELKKEGIFELYISVRKNNKAALKAYNKVGAKIVKTTRWIRIGGKNIPYLKV